MGPAADRPIRISALHLVAVAIVLMAVVVALWSLAPPAVVAADAPGSQFSAKRAMEHVAIIAAEPHPMGSPANGRVREYIGEQLAALGVEVEFQSGTTRNAFGSGELISIVNVIGRIPGTESTGAIVLMAHHDTVPATPGANDNSAAVAALLEAARALTSGPELRNDVVLLFTDAEEPRGRAGAREFLNGAVGRDVRFVVNFEAAGESGPALLAESNGGDWVIAELDAAVTHPAAFSFLSGLVELIGEVGTDFDPFREAGYPGLHFAYLRGAPIYHTAADSIVRLGESSLQHHGSHALGIAGHFGDLDLRQTRNESQIVYSMVGPLLVKHPAGWTVAVALVALALASLRLERRRLVAGGRAVLAGIASLIIGTAAWLSIAALRPTLGVVESYVYLAVLLIGTNLLARWAAGSRDRSDVATGVVAVWAALALVASIAAPGLSMMLAWPALAAGGALLWRPSRPALQSARFGLVALPTLVLVLPAIDVFWQFAQPRPGNLDSEVLAAVVVPILLGLLAAALIHAFWPIEQTGSASRRGAASPSRSPA
jgi:hypothetical protein